MFISILLDDIVDATRVFYRVWCIVDDHVWCLTRRTDMDITEFKDRLEYPWGMCIDLLDSIERTLGDISRKCWNLLDTNHSRIRDDKEVEFIIDPVDKDKCKKNNPIYRKSSPIERSSDKIHDRASVGDQYPRTYKERKKVKKMKDKDNPMSMKSHDDLFMFF